MKKKIVIVGAGPLPNEKEGVRDAAGLRTEQFFRPLQALSHEILLICICSHINGPREFYDKQSKVIKIERHDKKLISFISTKINNFCPDVALGINTYPSFVLSKTLPQNTPFWADLNGWIMAEAQARSWSEDNNVIFANAWRQERQILAKADKISTVSKRQKYCVIGEMASLGLLQKSNFLEKKVYSIANATKDFNIDKKDGSIKTIKTRKTKREKTLFRGTTVPDNAFVISWIGGYNNWVDEQTLFEGVENAMKKDKNIYFVSTGGNIKNIAGSVFEKFFKKIKKSQYKDRFVFLGWIKTTDMRKVYEESNAGINVDFACIETWTGARNRINEMLKFGLPVITTGGSEIAADIKKYNAGIMVENGNSTELTDSIVSIAKASKETLFRYQKNARHMSTATYNETMLTKPVQDFVNNPQKTTIRPLPLNSPFFFIQNIIWYLQHNGIKAFLSKISQFFTQ